MRVFVSAGEPSGDLHGANLIRHLRARAPGVEVRGFGGPRMAAAGGELLYPLCDLALVGFLNVLRHVPEFRRIRKRADDDFRAHRPDVLVLIDFPGFHWWLAAAARRHGVPVVYFVPPQLWAWASWRVRKMRRLVDRVLCNLPFEEPWYRARGVPAEWVGHPYFDEIRGQHLDPAFLADQRARGGTVVGLLPGSRDQEITYNLDSLLRTAGLVHARRPDTRFLVACLHEKHRDRARAAADRLALPVEVHADRTPEILELAHSCVAVSGSVGLELMARETPAVVFYRHGPVAVALGHLLKRCRYISLVNLLADRPLYPEYFGVGCPAAAMAADVLGWLEDPGKHAALRGELRALTARVAVPGACDRAAACVLDVARAGGQGRLSAA